MHILEGIFEFQIKNCQLNSQAFQFKLQEETDWREGKLYSLMFCFSD